jgi:mono/diheme cytochrome c family protein
MRHTAVTRVVLGLAALLAAASLLFAWLAAPRASGAAAPDGAALFSAACAGCHSPTELARGLQRAEDRLAAATRMLELLADHGSTSLAEDLAITGYLAGIAAPAPSGGGD